MSLKKLSLIYVGKACYKQGFKHGYKKGRHLGVDITQQKDTYLKRNLFEKYYKLHECVLDFAVRTNIRSYNKYSPPSPQSHERRISRGCLHRIGERAVIIHRSILSLCKSGWASMSPILLRSLLECLANTIAITNPRHNSEYMGFKFCTIEHLNTMIDSTDKKSFDCNNSIIQAEMEKMDDETKKTADKYVKEFLKRKQEKTWWFKPEYANTEDIFLQCSGAENLYNSFKVLSKSTHSTYAGLGLFKDKPDHVDVNPRADLQSSKEAIVLSSRLLIETCHMRDVFETLGCNDECDVLIKDLISLRDDVEGPTKNIAL